MLKRLKRKAKRDTKRTMWFKKKKKTTKKEKTGSIARKFNLHNLKIGWKYGLAFIFVFILLVGSTVLASLSLRQAQEDTQILNEYSDQAILTTELSDLIQSKVLSVLSYAQGGSQIYLDEFEEKSEEINNRIEAIEGQITEENQVKLFDEVVVQNQLLDEMFYDVIVDIVGEDENIQKLYTNRYNKSTVIAGEYLKYLREMIIEDRDIAAENAEYSQNFAQITLITSMIVSFVIGFIVIVIISRNVTKNLNNVVAMSDRIAAGDLRETGHQYQGNDELGQLNHSINQMRLQLTGMIDSIKQTSFLVSSQSEQLNQSASDVRSGTEQIAATMEELASGTETQANFAGDLVGTMSEFAGRIKMMNTSSESIKDASNNVLKESDLGNEYMNKSIEQMGNIDQIVKEAVTKVEGLNKQSEQISDLVKVVKDIADQTNLLALNAAIEAARAGDQGLGFAVVADEVRKLAEQVGDSVVGIAEIVNSIQAESESVSTALEQGYHEVNQGTEDIEATGVRFKSIEEAITTMTAHVQSVISGLEELNNDSSKVNEAVEEIASISEESAAGVEETSASAEEASTSMENVSAGAGTLLNTAKELSELVEKFKMD